MSEITEPNGAETARTGGAADLTIDELAQRTGMTVRNIRAHQSRGLLEPPEVRGRTGYYGPDHVARIELIQDLQADGFNLGSIRRLIESAGESSGEVLRFTQAVRAPFEDEEPEILDLSELADRFGEAARPELLERTLRLGLIRDLGDGRYEQRSPRLARAADELAALGVSPERGARGGDAAAPPRRGRGARVRRPVPRGGVEAVRGGRAAGGALARGARGARASSSAGRRLAACDVPARHDRPRGGDVGPRAGAGRR